MPDISSPMRWFLILPRVARRIRRDVFFFCIVIMSCVSCASMAGRYMCGSCGWTDLVFISRRNTGHLSVFLSTTSGVSWPVCVLRALTHVHVHSRVRFTLNVRHRHRDTCLSRVASCICHVLFASSTAHHAVPRHEDNVSLELL